MIARLYRLWVAAVLGVLVVAQLRGWSLAGTTESRTNPTSVRANPGAYRSPYFTSGRILRGK